MMFHPRGTLITEGDDVHEILLDASVGIGGPNPRSYRIEWIWHYPGTLSSALVTRLEMRLPGGAVVGRSTTVGNNFLSGTIDYVWLAAVHSGTGNVQQAMAGTVDIAWPAPGRIPVIYNFANSSNAGGRCTVATWDSDEQLNGIHIAAFSATNTPRDVIGTGSVFSVSAMELV